MGNRIKKGRDKKKIQKRMQQYYLDNKDKITKYKQQWRSENKEKVKWYHIKQTYGLTEKEYKQLLDDQGSSCKLCKKLFDITNIICVDHCHKTGKIRGLLHKKCNSIIGLADDSIELLELSIGYLKNTK
jgi:hypothetical protein